MTAESTRYPYVTIALTIEDHSISTEAVCDTGFDGDLAVPSELVPSDASPATYQTWRTAFESQHEAPVYIGTVTIGQYDAIPARIAVLGTETILVRGIIDRYSVLFDHGERVVIEL